MFFIILYRSGSSFKCTDMLSGSRETRVFCLVSRGGGKVGVARGGGTVGGAWKAGEGDGEGGTVRLFGCKRKMKTERYRLEWGWVSPSGCSASARADPL